jgi:hypothetical protein
MPRLRSVVPILALVLAAAGLASTGPAAAAAVTVTTEAQYRSALATLSADGSGPHTVTLGADITITGGTDPAYTGSQALTIDGDGHTLSGGDTRRVLAGTPSGSPRLTITDITLRDGFAAFSGGAVTWAGPVSVIAAQVLDNAASGVGPTSGGALLAAGDVTISDSTMAGNRATSSTSLVQGGAVQTSPGVWAITAERSVFRDNVATAATGVSGGVLRAIGDIEVTDVVATDNGADAGGEANGAFISATGTVTITRALIQGNEAEAGTATTGGAVYGGDGYTVTDAAFIGNDATGPIVWGSAIGSLFDVPNSLSDVTVAGNEATGADGQAAVYSGGTLTARHVTIVDNEATGPANLHANDLDATGLVVGRPSAGAPNCEVTGSVSATGSVDDDGTCLLVGPSNASDVADIGLGPQRDNTDLLTPNGTRTLFPLAGSPVIDRVPAGSCPDAVDQRGLTRPFGSACDAGAIEAVYEPHGFGDVPIWVEDAVRWVHSGANDPRLMDGITPTTFVPNAPITRAQVVRLLYRLVGQPDPTAYPAHPFTDVPPWVEPAVRWAYGEEIVTGITPTTFEPNDPITRGQVVRMVYRVAGSAPVAGIDPHPFTDVPPWVADAVRWAADTDNPLPLVTGMTPTTFAPNSNITRAQVARMVWRLAITPRAWDELVDPPVTVPFGRGGGF